MKLEKIEPTIKKNNKRDLFYSKELEKALKDLREISTFYSLYKFKDTLYAVVGWCDGSLEALSILPDTNERISLSPYGNDGYTDITLSDALEYFSENLLGAEEYTKINQPNIINKTSINFVKNDITIKLEENETYIVFQINEVGEYFIDKCIYNGFKTTERRYIKKLIFDITDIKVKDISIKSSVTDDWGKVFIFKEKTEKKDLIIKFIINEILNNYIYLKNKKLINSNIIDYTKTFVTKLEKILKNSI